MAQYDKGTELSAVPRRICGLLTARGRWAEWEKAFEHIAMHFRPMPMEPWNVVEVDQQSDSTTIEKPRHSLFHKKYRNERAVKELIRRAVAGPSAVMPTRLKIAGKPLGRDAVKIVRHFAEPVGDTPDLVCVVVIADSQGTLITAYPGTKKALTDL